MRVFKTKWFGRYAKHASITDSDLAEAIHRADRGMVDADLGAGLIKQRVARSGQGRSGGYRMLIALRFGDRAIFLHGFAKSERANISAAEMESLKDIAANWLSLDRGALEQAIALGQLQEVQYGESQEKS